MEKTYSISIYLDTRKRKNNNNFPCKLRVFSKYPRKQKLYNTKFEYTKVEFDSIWNTTKPRKVYKEERLKLQAIENRANEIAGNMEPFSFEDFERLLFSNKATKDVNYYYELAIDKLFNNGQISTANNYKLSLKSFKKYSGNEEFEFYEITPEWLKSYENWMINKECNSFTTVSMYTRTLRTVFNNAIYEKTITAELYPFGKRKYQPPNSQKIKKALKEDTIKKLYHGKPHTELQEKAKDFWFFSYATGGANFLDILWLRHKDIKNDSISFFRKKTEKTNRNPKPIKIYRNDIIDKVIMKYGNTLKQPNNFIFPIITPDASPEQQYNERKKFIRFIGQHFKKYAKTLEIFEDVNVKIARHSWATTMIRKGGSYEFVGEILGHSKPETTKRYFDGFEDEFKKELTQKAVDF